MVGEVSGGKFPSPSRADIEELSNASITHIEILVQLLTGTIQATPTLTSGILVVDDEAPIRFALKEYLSSQGLEVTCAGAVWEAEALLCTHEYAVAIVDLRLAGNYGLEGLEVLSGIRTRYPQTRTILLSANISPEVEQTARELGIDVLLHKPMLLSGVATIVFDLIHRYPTQQE